MSLVPHHSREQLVMINHLNTEARPARSYTEGNRTVYVYYCRRGGITLHCDNDGGYTYYLETQKSSVDDQKAEITEFCT